MDTHRNYATMLPMDHPAIPFMGRRLNYSDTLRVLLADLMKVNNERRDYPSIPEAERMKRYFHVEQQPTLEQRRTALRCALDIFCADKENLERLQVEAEYARLWRKFADNTVPEVYRGYAVTYVAISAREYYSRGSTSVDIDVMSELQRYAFVERMQRGDKEILEYNIDPVERDAIMLLLCLYDVWDIVAEPDMRLTYFRPDYCQLVSAVLTFLRRYYDNLYGLPGVNMLSAFCRYLLRDGVVRAAITEQARTSSPAAK